LCREGKSACGVRKVRDVSGAAVPPSGDLRIGDIDSFVLCAPSQDSVAEPRAGTVVDALELGFRDEYGRRFAPASDANGSPAFRLVHELRELIAGLGDGVYGMLHGCLEMAI
jgi:hypothetical protein